MVNKFENCVFDVVEILKKYSNSSDFWNNFVNESVVRPLVKKERKLVVNTLMDWIVGHRILLGRHEFEIISQRIISIFTREVAALYYRKPLGKKSNPTGLIYSSYRYRADKLRKDSKKFGQTSAFYK